MIIILFRFVQGMFFYLLLLLKSCPSRGSPNKNLGLLQKDPAYDYNALKTKPPLVKDRKTLEACGTVNNLKIDQAAKNLDDILSLNKSSDIPYSIIAFNNRDGEDPSYPFGVQAKEGNPGKADRLLHRIPFTKLVDTRNPGSIAGRLVALQRTNYDNTLSAWLTQKAPNQYKDNAFALNTYTGNGCRLGRYTDGQGYRLGKGGRHLKILSNKS